MKNCFVIKTRYSASGLTCKAEMKDYLNGSSWKFTGVARGGGYDKTATSVAECLKKISDSTYPFKYEGKLPDGAAGIESLAEFLKPQGWILKQVHWCDQCDTTTYEVMEA